MRPVGSRVLRINSKVTSGHEFSVQKFSAFDGNLLEADGAVFGATSS